MRKRKRASRQCTWLTCTWHNCYTISHASLIYLRLFSVSSGLCVSCLWFFGSMVLWFYGFSVSLLFCCSVALCLCSSVSLFFRFSVSFSTGPPLLVESHSTRTDSKSFSGVGPRRGKARVHCIGDKGNVHVQVLLCVYECIDDCIVLMYLGFFSWFLLLPPKVGKMQHGTGVGVGRKRSVEK